MKLTCRVKASIANATILPRNYEYLIRLRVSYVTSNEPILYA